MLEPDRVKAEQGVACRHADRPQRRHKPLVQPRAHGEIAISGVVEGIPRIVCEVEPQLERFAAADAREAVARAGGGVAACSAAKAPSG